MKRKIPKRVLIIAILAIVSPIMGTWITMTNLDNPIYMELLEAGQFSLTVQFRLALFGSLLSIIAGIFMLFGKNWARWLDIGWGAIVVGFSAINLGLAPLFFMALAPYLLFTVLLLTQKSNEYFCGGQSELRFA